MRISEVFAMGGSWGYRHATYSSSYSDDYYYYDDDFNGTQSVCAGNRCGGGGDPHDRGRKYGQGLLG